MHASPRAALSGLRLPTTGARVTALVGGALVVALAIRAAFAS